MINHVCNINIKDNVNVINNINMIDVNSFILCYLDRKEKREGAYI